MGNNKFRKAGEWVVGKQAHVTVRMAADGRDASAIGFHGEHVLMESSGNLTLKKALVLLKRASKHSTICRRKKGSGNKRWETGGLSMQQALKRCEKRPKGTFCATSGWSRMARNHFMVVSLM